MLGIGGETQSIEVVRIAIVGAVVPEMAVDGEELQISDGRQCDRDGHHGESGPMTGQGSNRGNHARILWRFGT